MYEDLRGRRVLVTGSSQGIGLAVARAFAGAGALVGLNARRAPEGLDDLLEDLGGPERAAFFAGDLSQTEACRSLVEDYVARFGGIDILVNNAGALVGRTPLEEIDDDFYAAVGDVNCRSALMCTRFALPHLRKAAADGGEMSSVILVGSIAGSAGGGPGAGLYGAAKAWLQNIQKNWVSFHTGDGIRFNTVSPGTVDTAFHADKTDAARQAISSGIPMGRFGRPEEMAPAFLFLASNRSAGYITGQVLEVNGGQYMP
ncbi:SDR family NAD(P)-dependent oxidoreductase [Mangrovicoccus algicola]|uniref:SDR family oxidoreductase n=1 Tax=Mangrovicoccus algicola TaxID=2771008 RepID=A0A8J6ZEH2_9RHOB|nr:SDR family oxidoreductase [Mangrovicoccus algicola]MBE3640160.1 SDR family oxidoreductase [Mangrovicoccus algicola]